LCCVKHITTDTLWMFLWCAHLLEPRGRQQWSGNMLAVLPDAVCSGSRPRVFTAKVMPEWCLEHCTSVENVILGVHLLL